MRSPILEASFFRAEQESIDETISAAKTSSHSKAQVVLR
jgi:hypothetical protein